MKRVSASKRVTVDRVMKYSNRMETWDFKPGVETAVPDEVADELVPQFPELTVVTAPPAPTSAEAGGYANRMMASSVAAGTCEAVTARGTKCGRALPCRYHSGATDG